MKSTIQIFSELGVRLAEFGADEKSRSVIAHAVAENEWFSVEDICYAVEAVRQQMLDADKIAHLLRNV